MTSSIIDGLYKKKLKEHFLHNNVSLSKLNEFQNNLYLLEQWAIDCLFELFRENDIFCSSGTSFDLKMIVSELNVAPNRTRLLVCLLNMMVRKHKIIHSANDKFELSPKCSPVSKAYLASKKRRIISVCPELEVNANLLECILSNAIDLLTSEQSVLPYLFPNGSFDVVEALYKAHSSNNCNLLKFYQLK
jgi:hypothetical protein